MDLGLRSVWSEGSVSWEEFLLLMMTSQLALIQTSYIPRNSERLSHHLRPINRGDRHDVGLLSTESTDLLLQLDVVNILSLPTDISQLY